MASKIHVRAAADADLPAITAIYAHWVLHGSASFEEVPPPESEMAARRQKVLTSGLPYLVAVDGAGAILGYAYATIYRERSAYRYTAEDSIYVHPEHSRKGVGAALLAALIRECEARGCRQMIAVIGDSANAASIGLHERMGFRPAGVLTSVGFKFGRWLDSVRMQRALGDGDATLPAGRPPARGP